MAIRLHTHLKRMTVKAATMEWNMRQLHKRIDEILDSYGVKNKLPKNRLKPANKGIHKPPKPAD